MKKTLALILAIVMALGCMSITAFAAENEAEITAEITAADFGYTMVIPTATTLTEANHENVLLGTDGKVSIKDIKHPTDKVNVVYTVDLSNGNLTDGTNTIGATYKYKQGANEFAAIDGTTKVTVYANKTVNDSLVNVTANKDQWNAAPAGTYNATVVFNFEKVEIVTVSDLLNTVEGVQWWNQHSGVLKIVNERLIYNHGNGIDLTAVLTKTSENTYFGKTTTDTGDNFWNVTFNTTNGILTSIVYNATSYSGTAEFTPKPIEE